MQSTVCCIRGSIYEKIMNDTERRRKRFFYWKETIELKCTGQRSDVTVTEMENSKIDDALMDHPSARVCVCWAFLSVCCFRSELRQKRSA